MVREAVSKRFASQAKTSFGLDVYAEFALGSGLAARPGGPRDALHGSREATALLQKDWSKMHLTVRVGPLLLADGQLDARERKFFEKLTKAQKILEERPLCEQDKRDVLLCLCRFVPGSAARVVAQFVFHPHEMTRPAAT